MTLEQEKEQAKLCVAWLATVNMHRAEEEMSERIGVWNEDEEWSDAVEDAKEEALEEGAYLYKPAQETLDYVKVLTADELWDLFEQVDTKTTKEDGTIFVKKEAI